MILRTFVRHATNAWSSASLIWRAFNSWVAQQARVVRWEPDGSRAPGRQLAVNGR